MKHNPYLLLALVSALAAPLDVLAAPVPTLFNTGVDASGASLADNQPDPHYELVDTVGNVIPAVVATAAGGFPVPPWLADDTVSAWLTPGNDTNGDPGDYVYRTTFDLTGTDPSTALIVGRWAADNGGTDIILNGTSLGIANTTGFGVYSPPFTISSGFVAGLNTLEFVANNAPSGANPTGLRVEMVGTTGANPPLIVEQPKSVTVGVGDTVLLQVVAASNADLKYQWQKNGTDIAGQTAAELTLSPIALTDDGNYRVIVSNAAGSTTSEIANVLVGISIPGVFSTGVDDSAQLLEAGATDPHYKLVESADPMYPGPNVVVLAEVFPIPPWIANGPDSKWISPNLDAGNVNAGLYKFRLTFDLAGLDHTKTRLSGRWSTDNSGANIFLNGQALGITGPGFDQFSPAFLITNGFQAGLNTIDFQVQNAPADRNPAGVRVELKGLAKPLEGSIAAKIVNQPVGKAVRESDNYTIVVGASGTGTLSYEWSKDGNPIAGETTSTLKLVNVTAANAGSYRVKVQNNLGSAESDPAIITIKPRVEVSLGLFSKVTIHGIVGRTYKIEYADNPANPVWQQLTNILLTADPTEYVDPTSALTPLRIYRAVPVP